MAAAAAAAALAAVMHCLHVCQAMANEIYVLTVRERLNTLVDYSKLSADDVSRLAAKLEKRTIADGRISLSQKVIKNIQTMTNLPLGVRARRRRDSGALSSQSAAK